ncbi:small ubiquitin-related modifier 3-like [Acyrthosiphon pisum]|uniref:Rad60/SUMO-like domain-containing protein n=1 Tax=Acyrthosiphon pisum TaxID=7029 RepID=A0A8R2AAK8_ACYPI|nr:small ubiquitin-related modifier 3-like [Acyrthosiphon pisum]|eukprot:XP_003240851.1 PREDICTED: small ubiquitin-related modifier 3-like [Acyrthosiphon pisum]
MTVLNTETPSAYAPSPDSPPPDAPAPVRNRPPHININVGRSDDTAIKFMIKKTTQFDKLMKTYCVACDLPLNGVRLFFGGRQVCRFDTASSLGIEHGDFIEALHDF